MANRFSDIAARSAEMTDRQLQEELSRVSSLSEEELERLLPQRSDQERFAELMSIVRGQTGRNEKVAGLRQNIERFGDVVVRVLEAVV